MKRMRSMSMAYQASGTASRASVASAVQVAPAFLAANPVCWLHVAIDHKTGTTARRLGELP